MNAVAAALRELPFPDRKAYEQTCSRFEDAWQGCGERPPDLAAFLPPEGVPRPLVLVGLASIDLEMRRRRGERRGAGAYREQFPELRAPELFLELVRWECDLARQEGETLDEVCHRYPEFADALRELFPLEVRLPVPDLPARFAGPPRPVPLGRGGMGEVYLAHDSLTNSPVAVKWLRLTGGDPKGAVARFRREVETLRQLNVPGIVRVIDAGEYRHRPYYAMEYCPGGNLEARLREGVLPGEEAARLVRILALTVQRAHAKGVIHRDLKPSNVLLTLAAKGQPIRGPKIADFGLAKFASAGPFASESGAVVGTPPYMAPEQAAGQPADTRTDVYGLGAILYECLTGRPPFQGENRADTLETVRAGEPVRPSRLNPKLKRDLETICLKCLEKDSRDRYADAAALAEDLRRFLDEEQIVARRPRRWAAAGKWVWRRRRAAAVLALVAALGGLSLDLAFRFGAANREVELSRRAGTLTAAINVLLEKEDRGPRGREQLEGLLDQLGEVDRPAALRLRAECVKRWLGRPRLERAEHAELDKQLRLLEAAGVAEAAALRHTWAQRGSWWQTVRVFQAPFADAASVFADGRAAPEEGGTVLRLAGGAPREPRPLAAPGGGDTELSVRLTAGWQNARCLGLVLRGAGPDQGYHFLLTNGAAGPGEPGEGPNFQELVERKGRCALEVRRGGSLLQRLQLPASEPASERLKLRAQREGDRLTFQVNDLEEVRVIDVFPLAGTSSWAVIGPAGAGLVSVQVKDKPLQRLPSPLEQGDALYHQAKYQKALEYFEQQARSGGGAVREARYKAGVCQLRSKRVDEARQTFTALAREPVPADRWTSLAAFQSLLLSDPNGDESEEMEKRLVRAGQQVERLAALLPDAERDRLLARYAPYTRSGRLFFVMKEDRRRIEKLERAALIERLATPSDEVVGVRPELVRAHLAQGNVAEARRIALELLAQRSLIPAWRLAVLVDLVWLTIQQEDKQQIRQLLRQMDGWAKGGDPSPLTVSLRVERARLLLALGEVETAAKELERYFDAESQRILNLDFAADVVAGPFWGKGPAGNQPVLAYLDACLCQGFLLQGQGKGEAARRAWERGFLKTRERPAGATYEAAVLASLCQRLEPDDAKHMVSYTFAGTDFQKSLKEAGFKDAEVQLLKLGIQLGKYVPEITLILKRSWKSKTGEAQARGIALRTMPFEEFLTAQTGRWLAEWLRILVQGCKEDAPELSPDESLVIEKMVTDARKEYVHGALTEAQLGNWLKVGMGEPKGWEESLDRTPATLRGPLAYMLACCYRDTYRNPRLAGFFLEYAKRQPPTDPALGRLLQRFSSSPAGAPAGPSKS